MKVSIERPVDSWRRLAELIEEHSDGGWIFRGVRDCTYRLTPKIGRPDARKDPQTGQPHAYNFDEEKGMVEEFERAARPYFLHQPRNNLELLAMCWAVTKIHLKPSKK